MARTILQETAWLTNWLAVKMRMKMKEAENCKRQVPDKKVKSVVRKRALLWYRATLPILKARLKMVRLAPSHICPTAILPEDPGNDCGHHTRRSRISPREINR